MNIKYLINNKSHKICFCPDKKGLKIRKKNKPDSNISNDLFSIIDESDKSLFLVSLLINFNRVFFETLEPHP